MRAVLWLISIPLIAQTEPGARALIKASGAALLQFKSYRLDQRMVADVSGPGAPARSEMLVKMAVTYPGKLRIESTGQAGSGLIVSDGENTWTYNAQQKQFTRKAAASGPETLVKSLTPGVSNGVLSRPQSKDPYLAAKVAGDETVEVEGKKIDCYVVVGTLDKIAMPGGISMTGAIQKLWIDKSTKIALKQTLTGKMSGGPLPGVMEMNQAVSVISQRMDEPVPDSLFVFTPPEGAIEVPAFVGDPDLTGKMALDFTAPSMDGKDRSLHQLRGGVVLLNFWATWCLPCQRDLPMLDKLQREYKGLTILGINTGESRDAIASFLAESKMGYPVLLSETGDIADDYLATAYPTLVLVDRAGKIVFYHSGAGAEAALRKSLADAGLGGTPVK